MYNLFASQWKSRLAVVGCRGPVPQIACFCGVEFCHYGCGQHLPLFLSLRSTLLSRRSRCAPRYPGSPLGVRGCVFRGFMGKRGCCHRRGDRHYRIGRCPGCAPPDTLLCPHISCFRPATCPHQRFLRWNGGHYRRRPITFRCHLCTAKPVSDIRTSFLGQFGAVAVAVRLLASCKAISFPDGSDLPFGGVGEGCDSR